MADKRPPRLFRRLLPALSAGFLALGIVLIPTAAFAGNGHSDHSTGNAGTSGNYNQPQPYSTADHNNVGANDTSSSNQYTSTRDGSASGNGSGTGQATGKPCAGCVGRADNKNPPGQYPNGSDANAGYECDRNHGIGQTNPAHTGCASSSVTSTPTTPPTSPTTTPTSPTTPTTTPTSPTTPTTTPGSSTTTPGSPLLGSGGSPGSPGGSVFTSGLGSASASVPLASPPAASIAASGASSSAGSGGALAFTGSDSSGEIVAGAVSLGVGLVLLRLSRRRRRVAG